MNRCRKHSLRAALASLTLAACYGHGTQRDASATCAEPALARLHPARADAVTADVALRAAGPDVYLTDARGRALYVSSDDLPDRSACMAECARTWRPFDVADLSAVPGVSADDFGRFKRPDGRLQLTYQSRPLYRFALDGDTTEATGDGFEGRFFLARPRRSVLASSSRHH